jgi:hypothetical protein
MVARDSDMMTRYPNTAHGRGQRVYPLPAWLSAANSEEWLALPASSLTGSGVGWSGASPGGSTYVNVVNAWSGGVLNTVGCFYEGLFHAGTFLVIWGGGHGDYAGNEVYAYGPLQADSPAWHRLTDPTVPGPSNIVRDGSGNPVSRHTYDTLVYLPTLNKMMTIGAPGYYQAGNTFNCSDFFDFSVDPSSVNPWSSNDSGFPAFSGNGTINLVSGYNQETGKVWGVGNGNGTRLVSFDSASLIWSGVEKHNPTPASSGKGAILPSANLLVFVNNSGVVQCQDLDSTASAIFSPTVTGTGPGSSTYPLSWDEVGGRFVSWGRTGKSLFFLTPGANAKSGGDGWAWSSVTPASGAVPSSTVTWGEFGRFQSIPGPLRGVLVMPNSASPIYYYKN